MEKMREEYEAWFCSTMPYKIAKESWFAVMDDGDYIIMDVQAGWAGWKASRAALCVELPSRISDDSDKWSVGYDFGVDAAADSLDSVGVHYKWQA